MSADGTPGEPGEVPLTSPTSELFADPRIKDCATLGFRGEERPALGGVVLLSCLGRGGMATVYYGHHPRLDLEVAVKVISRALLEGDPDGIQRFIREAQLAAKLQSEHLVHVYDIDKDPASGVYYIVMEYVRGTNASVWASGEGKGSISEVEALDVCIAASRGLQVAHREGVVHRDIKPANILLPRGLDGELVLAGAKLADLGLAKREEESAGLTQTEHGMGTPGYMAPEQIHDVKRVTKSADVFGMGATLYSLLARCSPFAAPSSQKSTILATIEGDFSPLREMRPDVSSASADLVARCLETEPASRFPDASDLLARLEECRAAAAADADATAPTVVAPRSTPAGAESRKASSTAIGLVVFALLAAVGVWWLDPLADPEDGTDLEAVQEVEPPVARVEPEGEASDPAPEPVFREDARGVQPRSAASDASQPAQEPASPVVVDEGGEDREQDEDVAEEPAPEPEALVEEPEPQVEAPEPEAVVDAIAPVVELEPSAAIALETPVVFRGSVSEQVDSVEIVEFALESGEPIGAVLRAEVRRSTGLESESWVFDERGAGVLSAGATRRFKLTARDAAGNESAAVVVDKHGAVRVGELAKVDRERNWIVVDSTKDDKPVLDLIEAGRDEAILADGARLRIQRVRNEIRNRGLTLVPAEGYALADFVGREDEDVYWLRPDSVR